MLAQKTNYSRKINSSWVIRDVQGQYKVNRKNNDIGWKKILDSLLPDFMQFCFPELAKLIDWSRPFEILDNELHAVTKDASNGSRVVDKLFKVYLLDGREQWVLLHIEVQGKKDETLPKRMFTSGFRINDKFDHPLMSCVILTDEDVDWRPDNFVVGFGGSLLSIKYHVVKLIDYRNRTEELKKSANPFAAVILVQLAAMEAKRKAPEQRFNFKLQLTRQLYSMGFNKQTVIKLLGFIDWLIALPKHYEVEYRNECAKLENEEANMAYAYTIEMLGMEKGLIKGREEGLQVGEATILIRQLKRKFSDVPNKYLQKIHEADAETLLVWSDKILDAKSIKEIFE